MASMLLPPLPLFKMSLLGALSFYNTDHTVTNSLAVIKMKGCTKEQIFLVCCIVEWTRRRKQPMKVGLKVSTSSNQLNF